MNRIPMFSDIAWSLHNFRRDLIRALLDLLIDKKGANPVRHMDAVPCFRWLYAKARPKLAKRFTIKPMINGNLTADTCGRLCIYIATRMAFEKLGTSLERRANLALTPIASASSMLSRAYMRFTARECQR